MIIEQRQSEKKSGSGSLHDSAPWKFRFTQNGIAVLLLVVALVARAQDSQFVCDPCGNLMSQASEAPGFPNIIGQPQDQVVAPGASASFSVIVADTRGLTYQWQFIGGDIPGATGDTLLLTNVSTSNEGAYSVVLINGSGSITSASARLFIDSNANGLPDSWELAHFGRLVSATGDFDGDGVSNLQEYLDGTDPTNALSALYRINLGIDGGTVVVFPDQLAFTNGQTVTLTAVATNGTPFHAWIGDVNSRSNTISLVMNANKTLFAYFSPITFQWTNSSGGDWNVASSWTPNLSPGSNDNAILIAAVTVTLNNDLDLNDLTLGNSGYSPIFTGTGALTLHGTCTWANGTMSGSGRTIIAQGGVLNLVSTGPVWLSDRTLENAGTVNWSGPGSLGLAGVITNDAGGVFIVQNPSTLNFFGGSPRFDNAGTFRKSVSTGTTTIGGGVPFNNYNNVEIQAGTLLLLGGGVNNGSMNVPTGTVLELAGAFNASVGSSISGAGQFTLSGGTATLAGLVNVTGINIIANGTANLTGNYFCTNNTLTISGATANFDGTGTVAPAVLNLFGVLGGAQTVTVGSVMNWTGGTMNGTGRTVIPPGATLNADLQSFASMTTRTLENGGTTIWTGLGSINLNDAVITNRPGALFSVQNALSINPGGGAPRFDNAGTFRKSISAGQTSFSGVSFNNYNDVEILTGTLSLLGGGLNNSTISVPAGTALELGGTFNSSVGSSISGAGQFTATFGTVTLAGLVNVTGSNIFVNGTANLTGNYFCTNNTLTISGATANFHGTGTVAPAVLNLFGVLGGAQTVTVGSAMNWTGGAMNGTGRTVIPPGVTLNAAIPSFVSMTTRTLENGGTTIWTGLGSINLNDAVITNQPGALFWVQNALSVNYGGGAPRFDNAGTFRKSISAGQSYFSNIAFNNYNNVEIQAGTLSLIGGGLNNSTINVSAGTVLELAGAFSSSAGSSILGAGQFTVSGGTATLAGLVNVTGTNIIANGTANLIGNYFCTNNILTISSGTANFDGTGTVAPTVLNLFGVLGGAQTVTVGNVMNWTGGAMNGTGRTVIPPGATLNVAISSFASLANRTLENGGTTVWTGPGNISLIDAVITNRAGGLFSVQNASGIFFGGGSPRFDNAGTFRKSVSTGTTTIGGSVNFTNYGTVDVRTGILEADGGYASTSNAVLNCAIGGTSPGTGYGQLHVAGTTAPNGALSVGFANGFSPALGDSFTVLTAGAINGAFSNLLYPSNNVAMQLSNAPNAVIVRVTDINAPPPPLLSAQVLGTNLNLTWNAASNFTYRVEFKPGLAFSNWSALPGDVTSTGRTAAKVDPLTPSNRFYRVRLLP